MLTKGAYVSKKNERLPAPANGKGLKPYREPTLTKGPMLSNVTADGGRSGVVPD